MGNSAAKEKEPRSVLEVPSQPGSPTIIPRDGNAENQWAYLTQPCDCVIVTWDAPDDDGGSPITNYILERRLVMAAPPAQTQWLRAFADPFPETQLALNNLIPGHTYQFRVKAQNIVGFSATSRASEPFTVPYDPNLACEPRFVEPLRDVTALEHERVEFRAEIQGVPPPRVTWYKDGIEVHESPNTEVWLHENGQCGLVFLNVNLRDSGDIKCVANNGLGQAIETALLTVETPPRALIPKQYEEGLIFETGDTIRLKVGISGRPVPEVSWYHETNKLEPSGRYEIETSSQFSTLKVLSASRQDRGEYSVRLISGLGEDTGSILVTITNRPTPPGRPRVTEFVGNSVVLEWDPPEDDGGCKIGNYVVEYFRMGWNVWLKATACRQLSAKLGDLIPGSTYKFRIKAENPYGMSESSPESIPVILSDSAHTDRSWPTMLAETNSAADADDTTVGSSILPSDSANVTEEDTSAEIMFLMPRSTTFTSEKSIKEPEDVEESHALASLPWQTQSAPDLCCTCYTSSDVRKTRKTVSCQEILGAYLDKENKLLQSIEEDSVSGDLLSGIGSTTGDSLSKEVSLDVVEDIDIDLDTVQTEGPSQIPHRGFWLPKSPARVFVHEAFVSSPLTSFIEHGFSSSKSAGAHGVAPISWSEPLVEGGKCMPQQAALEVDSGVFEALVKEKATTLMEHVPCSDLATNSSLIHGDITEESSTVGGYQSALNLSTAPVALPSAAIDSIDSDEETAGDNPKTNSPLSLVMEDERERFEDSKPTSEMEPHDNPDFPFFVRALADQSVKVGTRARLLTEIKSSSKVQVNWRLDGKVIEDDASHRLLQEGTFFGVDIAPVFVGDEGVWTCEAANFSGSTSSSASLRVIVPKSYKAPEFVEELRALLTQEGTVSLECKVVGIPTPVLKWFKDGQEIKAGDVFALTARADDPTSLGVYTCEAVNCVGKAVSSSKVHVLGCASRESSAKPLSPPVTPACTVPAPIIVEDLFDQKVKVGEGLRLGIRISDASGDPVVQWFNKDELKGPCDKYHYVDEGEGVHTLEIAPLELEDEGEWKCVVSNDGGQAASSCFITLLVPKNYRPPRFLENLKAILTEEGLVSFECKVVGFPTPQLQWFKDGQELKPGDVYQLSGTNSLGSYSCIARNCMGQATSSAELTVEDIQNQLNEDEKRQLLETNQPPVFLQGLRSTEAKIGDLHQFTVQVTVTPEPTVTWYRDDELIETSDRCRILKEDPGIFSLEISTLSFADQADWKCIAVNDFGHSVTSCSLKLSIPRHYKKPYFLEPLKALLSEEGTVNLECKVIGVPQPTLKWFKDGVELKPGDIHRIISGQDGTCCLGTYTCEAHNCMGEASSSAALVGFEERASSEHYTPVQHPVYEPIRIARQPSLSTIQEERSSQYSLYETAAADNTFTEISVSIDGKEMSLSLYETPDLTEEEAQRVVELFAEEISEHYSSRNVIELPPLRFTRESATAGCFLVEAIVIDVPLDLIPDEEAHTISDLHDDLETEADIEELSAMEALVVDEHGRQEHYCLEDLEIPPLETDFEIRKSLTRLHEALGYEEAKDFAYGLGLLREKTPVIEVGEEVTSEMYPPDQLLVQEPVPIDSNAATLSPSSTPSLESNLDEYVTAVDDGKSLEIGAGEYRESAPTSDSLSTLSDDTILSAESALHKLSTADHQSNAPENSKVCDELKEQRRSESTIFVQGTTQMSLDEGDVDLDGFTKQRLQTMGKSLSIRESLDEPDLKLESDSTIWANQIPEEQVELSDYKSLQPVEEEVVQLDTPNEQAPSLVTTQLSGKFAPSSSVKGDQASETVHDVQKPSEETSKVERSEDSEAVSNKQVEETCVNVFSPETVIEETVREVVPFTSEKSPEVVAEISSLESDPAVLLTTGLQLSIPTEQETAEVGVNIAKETTEPNELTCVSVPISTLESSQVRLGSEDSANVHASSELTEQLSNEKVVEDVQVGEAVQSPEPIYNKDEEIPVENVSQVVSESQTDNFTRSGKVACDVLETSVPDTPNMFTSTVIDSAPEVSASSIQEFSNSDGTSVSPMIRSFTEEQKQLNESDKSLDLECHEANEHSSTCDQSEAIELSSSSSAPATQAELVEPSLRRELNVEAVYPCLRETELPIELVEQTVADLHLSCTEAVQKLELTAVETPEEANVSQLDQQVVNVEVCPREEAIHLAVGETNLASTIQSLEDASLPLVPPSAVDRVMEGLEPKEIIETCVWEKAKSTSFDDTPTEEQISLSLNSTHAALVAERPALQSPLPDLSDAVEISDQVAAPVLSLESPLIHEDVKADMLELASVMESLVTEKPLAASCEPLESVQVEEHLVLSSALSLDAESRSKDPAAVLLEEVTEGCEVFAKPATVTVCEAKATEDVSATTEQEVTKDVSDAVLDDELFEQYHTAALETDGEENSVTEADVSELHSALESLQQAKLTEQTDKDSVPRDLQDGQTEITQIMEASAELPIFAESSAVFEDSQGSVQDVRQLTCEHAQPDEDLPECSEIVTELPEQELDRAGAHALSSTPALLESVLSEERGEASRTDMECISESQKQPQFVDSFTKDEVKANQVMQDTVPLAIALSPYFDQTEKREQEIDSMGKLLDENLVRDREASQISQEDASSLSTWNLPSTKAATVEVLDILDVAVKTSLVEDGVGLGNLKPLDKTTDIARKAVTEPVDAVQVSETLEVFSEEPLRSEDGEHLHELGRTASLSRAPSQCVQTEMTVLADCVELKSPAVAEFPEEMFVSQEIHSPTNPLTVTDTQSWVNVKPVEHSKTELELDAAQTTVHDELELALAQSHENSFAHASGLAPLPEDALVYSAEVSSHVQESVAATIIEAENVLSDAAEETLEVSPEAAVVAVSEVDVEEKISQTEKSQTVEKTENAIDDQSHKETVVKAEVGERMIAEQEDREEEISVRDEQKPITVEKKQEDEELQLTEEERCVEEILATEHKKYDDERDEAAVGAKQKATQEDLREAEHSTQEDETVMAQETNKVEKADVKVEEIQRQEDSDEALLKTEQKMRNEEDTVIFRNSVKELERTEVENGEHDEEQRLEAEKKTHETGERIKADSDTCEEGNSKFEQEKREDEVIATEDKRLEEEQLRAEEQLRKEDARLAAKEQEKERREQERRDEEQRACIQVEEKNREEELTKTEQQKREEQLRADEEKRKEEQMRTEKKNREEEEQLQAEKQKREEERTKAERQKREEEERIEAEEKKREDERILAEKQKREEEDRLKAEERNREEERLRAEEARRQEEERIKAEKLEEQELLLEEMRKREEQERFKAEEEKRQEEERLKAEEKKRQEEERALAEQKRREEERRKAEEARREEEERIKAEERKREEEARILSEKKKQEEERLRAEEERRKEEERTLAERKREEERIKAEEKQREEARILAEKKREEEEQIVAEKKKREEERVKAEEERRKEEERIKAEEKKREEQEKIFAEKKKREEEERLKAEEERRLEEERIKAEKIKREEEVQVLAEKKKREEEERLKGEEERRQKEERIKAEKIKREEEAQVLAEKKKREEEERLKAEEERRQEEERIRAEKIKREEEARVLAENKKREEERILAEQKKREEEERIRAEEKRREEARVLAEKKRVEEERIAAEKKHEEARILAEKQKREEEERILAEKKREQEEQILAEKKKREEEERILMEKKKREEEERMRAEEKKREEERLKAEEERRKREERIKAEEKKREEERQEAEKKKREEEARVRAEQKRLEEERLMAEKKKHEEEERLKAEQKRREEEREKAEEKKRKEEERVKAEQKRLEEERILAEKKKHEEERILAENKKREEEERIKAEEKKREEARILAQKKREEERILAEKKRDEEEKMNAEKKKREEEARVKAEQEKREEEERVKAEEKRRQEEKKRAEEQQRLAAEKKKSEEKERIKAEQEKRDEEQIKKKEEERQRLEAERLQKEAEDKQRLDEAQAKKREAERQQQEAKSKSKETCPENTKESKRKDSLKHREPEGETSSKSKGDESKVRRKKSTSSKKAKKSEEPSTDSLIETAAATGSKESSTEKAPASQRITSEPTTQPKDSAITESSSSVTSKNLKDNQDGSVTELRSRSATKPPAPEGETVSGDPDPSATTRRRRRTSNLSDSAQEESQESLDFEDVVRRRRMRKTLSTEKSVERDLSASFTPPEIRIDPVLSKRNYEDRSTIQITPRESSRREETMYKGGLRDPKNKPKFSTKLRDMEAARGSNIKLTCSVLGSPEPHIEWYKNGFSFSEEDSDRFRLSYDASTGIAILELRNVVREDSGEYTCVAKNCNGRSSVSADLRIRGDLESKPSPPSFVSSLRDSYDSAKDELVLDSVVRGYPQPKITWFKDGAKLHLSSRHRQFLDSSGKCKLVIYAPSMGDAGHYTCIADNREATDEVSAFINVPEHAWTRSQRPSNISETCEDEEEAPAFSQALSDQKVHLGGSVTFHVSVSGSPEPEVCWLFNNSKLPPSSKIRYLTPQRGIHSFSIYNVTASDLGTYACRATNVAAPTTVSSTAQPSVATFVEKPESFLDVARDQDLILACTVAGYPKPTLQWSKGSRDLSLCPRVTIEELEDNTHQLTLKKTTYADSGTYCIQVRNGHGSQRAFCTVRVKEVYVTTGTPWELQGTANIIQDLEEKRARRFNKDVPGPIPSPPTATAIGKNFVSLSWSKPSSNGGAPIMAYKVEAWLIGEGAHWTELAMSPITSYDAYNLKPEREYLFRITPRNKYGWGEPVTSTSPIKTGALVQTPRFITPLHPQMKILLGSRVSLQCEMFGVPVPRVKWSRDGSDIDPSKQSRYSVKVEGTLQILTINEVSAEDDAKFVCEANNAGGTCCTSTRLLVVEDPRIVEADENFRKQTELLGKMDTVKILAPQFTMRPRDRRVQVTYPVRLTCQVVGFPKPEITWKFNYSPIVADERHTFCEDGDFHTLEISNTKFDDAGLYQVHAQNSQGAITCPCRLIVDGGIKAYIPPIFVHELEDRTVNVGSSINLVGRVEAYPAVGVTWYRDGVRLRPSRKYDMCLDRDGTVTLLVANAQVRDAGVYMCEVTNEMGKAETFARVTVKRKEGGESKNDSAEVDRSQGISNAPRFLQKPRSTEVLEGDSLVILCEVVGDPKPEVIWLRDWLNPDYYHAADQFVREGDGPVYRLEIPCVKLDYTGAYSVIARNCHGEAKAVLSLQVYAHGQGTKLVPPTATTKLGTLQKVPEISQPLRDLRCCDGDAVTFECRVCPQSFSNIRWEKSGKLLRLLDDFVPSFDGECAQLTIKRVYPEDEGEYTCIASNELGRVCTSACLIVDVADDKENDLTVQLDTRPPGTLSTRTTPRTTPARSFRSQSPCFSRQREGEEAPALQPRTRVRAVPPKFYSVPHNKIAEVGDTVRFQCSVAGHPSPKVTWDKDYVTVRESEHVCFEERDDVRTLVIKNVTAEDAGLYRVTVENELGRIQANARLEILTKTSYRHLGSVRSGSAGRSGLGSYYPSLRSYTRSSTTRNLGMTSRAGEIRGGSTPRPRYCTNGLDDVKMANLSVQEPTFSQGLKHVTVRDGDSLELSVIVQGTPPLEIVWVRNDKVLKHCEDYEYLYRGSGHFALRIRDIFQEDGGIYFCEAYNAFGEAESWCRVNVEAPMELLDNQVTTQYATPNPVVSTSDLENSVALTEKSVSKCEQPIVSTLKSKPVPLSARVSNIQRSSSFGSNCNKRPLSCVNSQTKLQRTSSLRVSRNTPLRSNDSVTQSNDDIRTNKTNKFKLSRPSSVTKLSAPKREIKEKSKAQPSSTTERKSEELQPSLPVLSPPELTQKLADGFPQADPVCLPVDTTLEPEVFSAYDPYSTPAEIVKGPVDISALRGTDIVLEALVIGRPEPAIRWLKGGKELRPSSRVTIRHTDGVVTLAINNITADDSGKYIIMVENEHGADCHYASLAVEGPPDPPAGPPNVCEVRTDGVTLSWYGSVYDGGSMVIGYVVEMCCKPSDSWVAISDCCNSTSYVVQNLERNGVYSFRLRAQNIHGLSVPSKESEPVCLEQLLCEDDETGEDAELIAPFAHRITKTEPGEEFKKRYHVQPDIIGKGRFGVVYRVTELETKAVRAAKCVRCIKTADREKVYQEIDIMNKLEHPKLLQLASAFEFPKEIIMVMEYVPGGELFERVVADDFTLTEKDCILFMRQIVDGVGYMHSKNIVHLDLKPENILCQSATSHQIKLIDFGLARELQPDVPVRVLFGTPEFIPPEIVSYEPISFASDMWAVGVVCYVLLSGLSPFMGDNDADTFANITRADFDFLDEAFNAISQDAKDFISALLIKRPEERLTAQNCLKHKWLAQAEKTMKAVKLPTDRLKKFIIRRKWHKTGNAIRALGRMASLSSSRRNSASSSHSPSRRSSRMDGSLCGDPLSPPQSPLHVRFPQNLDSLFVAEEKPVETDPNLPVESTNVALMELDNKTACRSEADSGIDSQASSRSVSRSTSSYSNRSDSGMSDCSNGLSMYSHRNNLLHDLEEEDGEVDRKVVLPANECVEPSFINIENAKIKSLKKKKSNNSALAEQLIASRRKVAAGESHEKNPYR